MPYHLENVKEIVRLKIHTKLMQQQVDSTVCLKYIHAHGSSEVIYIFQNYLSKISDQCHKDQIFSEEHENLKKMFHFFLTLEPCCC